MFSLSIEHLPIKYKILLGIIWLSNHFHNNNILIGIQYCLFIGIVEWINIFQTRHVFYESLKKQLHWLSGIDENSSLRPWNFLKFFCFFFFRLENGYSKLICIVQPSNWHILRHCQLGKKVVWYLVCVN